MNYRSSESSFTAPNHDGGLGHKSVHLLVMGLSAAGKSTFILKATADEAINSAVGDPGAAQVVRDYVLYHKGYEIHLIDSPSFNDPITSDHQVLHRVCNWINAVYNQGWTIGGVLYLYDMDEPRLDSKGEQSLRLLEEMIGRGNRCHISLIATDRPPSKSPGDMKVVKEKLKWHSSAWKSLLEGSQPARLCHFTDTQKSALDIISPHLGQAFEPAITYEMVNPDGPRLALGATTAGRVLHNNYISKATEEAEIEEDQMMNRILGQRFDDQQVKFAIQGMMAQVARARSEAGSKNIGHWAIRLSMVGASILVSLMVEHPDKFAMPVDIQDEEEPGYRRQQMMSAKEVAAINKAIADSRRK